MSNPLNNPLDLILGQSKSLSRLTKIKETGRYPSAFLFHGLPGVGKSFAALQYAKYINLTSDPESDRRMIESVDRGDHPDIKVYSKGEDSSFKIDLVRSALEETRNPLVEARRRVLIFENIQDFPSFRQSDALLKTVEDGYDDTLFIFTTTDLESVSSTLVSRMCLISFSPLENDVLDQLLPPSEDESLRQTSILLSGGSLDQAKALLFPESSESLTGLELRNRAFKLLKNISEAPVHVLLSFVDKIPASDLDLFFTILMSIIQDVLLLEENVETSLTNSDTVNFLQEIVKKWDGNSHLAFKEFKVLHERKHQKGLLFSHQLKSVILRARTELIHA